MPELVPPAVAWHAAWLDAHREWGSGQHEDGFGLHLSDEVESAAGFAAWVARLTDATKCRYRWITEDDRLLGGIALRHQDTDIVRRFGHIGYGIRPSARGRGVATWALAQTVTTAARDFGLDQVLLVCEADNVASAKTIERNGGVLEKIEETEHATVRRYWIKTHLLQTTRAPPSRPLDAPRPAPNAPAPR